MDGSQQIPVEQRLSERCPRCKQPVEPQNTRCVNCGQPISRAARSLTLWIGVGGIGTLIFVFLLMWLVVRNDDLVKAPPPVDDETAARQALPIPAQNTPDTSNQAEKEPAKPDKPPPLNR